MLEIAALWHRRFPSVMLIFTRSTMVLLGLMACQNNQTEATRSHPGIPKPIVNSHDQEATCARLDLDDQPEKPPLKLIEGEVYQNTLKSLFLPAAQPKLGNLLKELPQNPQVSSQGLGIYFELALTMSENIQPHELRDPPPSCSSIPRENSCLAGYLTKWTEKLWGRSITSAELGYWNQITLELSQSTHKDPLNAMMALLFQSPDFLYRSSPTQSSDPSANPQQLRSWVDQLAAKTLRGPPPDWLVQLAASNRLNSYDQRYEAVKRLLNEEKAQDTIMEFYIQWLGIDSEGSEDFSKSFVGDDNDRDFWSHAITDLKLFARNITFDQKGSLKELLTSRYIHPDSKIKKLYRIGSDQQNLDREERAGILTRVGFLMGQHNQASPILRGVRLLDHVLCQNLPPPPDQIIIAAVPDLQKALQDTRTLTDKLTGADGCQGCHSKINPAGYVFGHYDAMGRYQELERIFGNQGQFLQSQTTDTAIEFMGAEVSDAVALSEQLASSSELASCFVQKLDRYFAAESTKAINRCQYQAIQQKALQGQPLLNVIAEVLMISL